MLREKGRLLFVKTAAIIDRVRFGAHSRVPSTVCKAGPENTYHASLALLTLPGARRQLIEVLEMVNYRPGLMAG